MTTRELIQAEIDRMSEAELNELYDLIRNFVQTKPQAERSGKSIMEKLREIQFDGPEDFAANLDLYLSGEKSEESDIR